MRSNKTQQIRRRIQANGRGWVFTPKHFLDLASRNVVDQVLLRLTKQGVIRKIDRGFYDYPQQSALLGTLSPDPDLIAQALATKKGDMLQPSGAQSANLLGLTTQVPAKRVYLTNGKSIKKRVGAFSIIFKHTAIPLPARQNAHKAAATLQALLYLGRDGISSRVINKCRHNLSDHDKQQLIHLAPQSPGWVAKYLQQIVT